MLPDQVLILAVLLATVAMFLWGRWRHDVVALASLLTCVVAGLVPAEEAFAGFGHPAVVTVACVLVLSFGLQRTGAVDALARNVLPGKAGRLVSIATLTGLAAILSGFMNNVGALALLMPVGMRIAKRLELPAGKVLMPLSFGSILGGMTTMIGTPPNLIVSAYRAENGAGAFGMFDFSPVGTVVAAAGTLFVIAASRFLVPTRERAGVEGFETGAYLTEVRVESGGKSDGMTLRDLGNALGEADAQVLGLVRDDRRIPAPSPIRELRAGDVLVIEAEPEALASLLGAQGLKLEEDVRRESTTTAEAADGGRYEISDAEEKRKSIQSEGVVLMELAVRPDAAIAGRSATEIRLRSRYGVNLLAVSRQGRRSISRLRSTQAKEGDVLLVQGAPGDILEFAADFGCVPLADRALRIPDRRQAAVALIVMMAAIAAVTLGLLPAAVAFAAGALAMVVLGLVSLKAMYASVDWPVVVLLAALIPVAGAMSTTGAADVLARVILETFAQGSAVVALTLVLVVTMTMSDFVNNAATAAVMCPIAIGTAARLDVSGDPFLMAVAVGASCAFLTPIGHQNNTLILGPGGFKFGDYWRLGVPLEMIVVAVGVPLLLLAWPF